jgi:hypothetical protein
VHKSTGRKWRVDHLRQAKRGTRNYAMFGMADDPTGGPTPNQGRVAPVPSLTFAKQWTCSQSLEQDRIPRGC